MSNYKLSIGIGVLALVSGGLCVFLASGETREQEPLGATRISEGQAKELAAMRRELRSLRGELRSTKERVLPPSTADLALRKHDEHAKANDARADPPELAPSMIPNKAAERRYQAQLEDVVEDESIDATWALSAENQLKDRVEELKTQGIDIKIRALKCASTLCKVEIADQAGGAAAGGLRQLSQALPWNGDGYVHLDPEDPSRVLMYLSRDGRALPRPAG